MSDDNILKLAVSVKTAAQMVEASETTIREEINAQRLPAFRIGRGIRIDVDELRAWTGRQIRVGSEGDRP